VASEKQELGALSPAWKRTVALFLVGQAVTLFGTMITGYAISWYVTLQTQSGIVLMLFTIALMVPMAVASPLGGVWADRYNRKYLINFVDAVIALVTLVMALLFSAGIQWLGLLFVCMLVRGFGQGIQLPAVSAILPDIVPADQLVRVNGFSSAIQSLSTFASPMAAAGLLSFFPVQALMYVDVATAVIGISIVFFCVRTHRGWRRSAALSATDSNADVELAASTPKPGFFSEFTAGLRYMRHRKFILAFLVIGIVFNVFAVPAAFLPPLQVVREFGADAWRLGAVEVVFSVGMMLGGVIVGVWGGFKNRTFTMASASLAFGLGAVGLGILNSFWIYLACMGVIGIIMPFFNSPMSAILQEKTDPDFMGRVLSVFMMIGSLTMPLGMAFFGPLADLVPIDWLLIVGGIGMSCASVCLVAVRVTREAGVAAASQTDALR